MKAKKGVAKKKGRQPAAKPSTVLPLSSEHLAKLEGDIKNLSEQELRELLMITMYKMALLRSQVETLNNVLIRNRLTTYEELWKDTNENFKNTI